ncbi:MAG: hypothetical protein LBT64_00695 [Puniceicoccales bacterium]|jgi:hypothetical protein|nr:hypothetical protein [Puniceicoccales bacterium]
MAEEKDSWCVVYLGNDYNWWVHENSEDGIVEDDTVGILDPKQVERMGDLLLPLKPHGLSDEVVNGAFTTYAIDREMPKEMLKIRSTKDNIFNPREPIFCLPNVIGDNEGPFSEFIDHIMAMRVKLLNSSIDFQRPLNSEEIEDILHAEQQERYISGIKTHAFDEIVSILDYVPDGYSLDEDAEEEESEEDALDLQEFDDEVDDSLSMSDEKGW